MANEVFISHGPTWESQVLPTNFVEENKRLLRIALACLIVGQSATRMCRRSRYYSAPYLALINKLAGRRRSCL